MDTSESTAKIVDTTYKVSLILLAIIIIYFFFGYLSVDNFEKENIIVQRLNVLYYEW